MATKPTWLLIALATCLTVLIPATRVSAASEDDREAAAVDQVKSVDPKVQGQTTRPSGDLGALKVSSVLTVSVIGAERGGGGRRRDAAVFRSSEGRWVATQAPGSTQLAFVYGRPPKQATSLSYRLSSPLGPVSLVSTAEGGVQVLVKTTSTVVDFQTSSDGVPSVGLEEIGYLEPAWARTGSGQSVGSSYSIVGSDVVMQRVDAGAAVADPRISCGIATCSMYFSRSETSNIASGVTPGFIFGLCAFGGFIVATGCAGILVPLTWTAQLAEQRDPKGCLRVRYLRFSPNSIVGYYYGSC
jgi:hypothetical protein